uniref:Tubby C-terminal domain-containing protein n=1 Tax=Tetradesmus obliquus TaxID=3088 RepID=A0A383VRU5_TETOB|eukprot:jgi/Sobl393_1/3762/SZX67464.1
MSGYPPPQAAPAASAAGHAAAAGHAPAGTAQQLVVVSPNFCLPQQVTLVMQESLGAYRNDDFHICDASGTTFFLLKAAPYSVSGRRALLDAYGQPCIHMERKLTSLRGSWQLLRSRDGLQLAVVKPSLSSFTPTIKVMLNDGDDNPDFIIAGDFRAKSFAITQCRSNAVIGRVKKESSHASVNAFLMSQLVGAQKYFVSIEPGVDAAFVVALATLCDEIFHDQQR